MKKWLRRRPALALFFIAPIFGELFSGSMPLNEFINPIAFLTMAMLYGSGAIIARELIVRWQKGWLSLLLLGFAYGIYEEGLMVRSFFDPNWVDLGSLGVYGRVAGVNWVWAYHLTVYHAVVSVVASITFVTILYPDYRNESWVTSKKWRRINWALLLLTLPLGKALTPYDAPNGWILFSWLVILGLIGLARVVLDLRLPLRKKTLPGPWRFFWLAFWGVFMHHILIYIGADEGAYPFPIALLLTGSFDLLILVLALRWSGNFSAWDDRSRMAFLTGTLGFFLILTPLIAGRQYPIMYVSNPFFLLALWWAYRRVARRATAQPLSAEHGNKA